MKAVRFNGYGDVDVLQVVQVPTPQPGVGEVLVRMRTAGVNLGESKIRQGLLAHLFPSTFPSGQGSDLAGTVEAVGPEVDAFRPGDEVLGWTDSRASHAEYVVTSADQVAAKPAALGWEVAGGLFVIGTTAHAAVRAVDAGRGDVVVVAGAAGGVGSIAAQLLTRAGARVIGIAGAADQDWLGEHGIEALSYGDGIADRLRAVSDRTDALIDTVGHGYVDLGLQLGIPPHRIDTIVDFAAAQRYGVRTDGNAAGATATTLAELAGLAATGQLDVVIDRVFPLDDVRDAFRYLETKHARGKVLLQA